eukprot:XP_001701446.1 voltage-gated Ca2+ channel, alpha subunit [Chlamydomonas reinhardtii]
MASQRSGFDGTPFGQILFQIDYVYISIFTVEALLKIIAMGLVMEKKTYLRDGWNVLDFLVVVSGFVNLAVPTNLTGIRTVRALRPLRTVNRVLVTTMLSSLPMLMDVFVLCAFCFFMFGIIAVQLFAGVLRNRCGNPDFSGAYNVTQPDGLLLIANTSYVVPDQEADSTCSGPLSAETTWYYIDGAVTAVLGPSGNGGGRVCDTNMFCMMYRNPNYGMTSYDHILWSWLTIFQHITLSGWTDTMYMTQDAVSFWVWPFYLALVIFGSFFMINLALAVLSINFSTDNFKEEQHAKEAEQNERRWLSGDEGEAQSQSGPSIAVGPGALGSVTGALMLQPQGQSQGQPQASAESEEKLNAMLLLQARHKRHEADPDEEEMAPGAPPPPGLGPMRRAAWRMSVSRWLEILTAVVIILNTVLMCINWFEMPESVAEATNYINYVFTIYFLLEMILKMTGFGLARYFRDGMNIFDCLVVVISVTEMVLDIIPSVSGLGPLSVLRAFRLLRIFRLARSWRDLNIIIRGMFNSVKASFMLVLLMVLFLFIAALVGMQLFGYQFMFCDYVEGAAPTCPLGWNVWGQCPDHFHCYLPCTSADYGSWVNATGSFYNDLAYCERFCANDQAAAAADANATSPDVAAAGGCEYLANVGKSEVPRANFDNIFWALFSVFQVLTGENWNDVMVNSMRTLSPWASLYFVCVILIGNYLVFNLFIAILLDNLQFTDELRKEDERTEARKANKSSASRRGTQGAGASGTADGGSSGKAHDGLQLLAAALQPLDSGVAGAAGPATKGHAFGHANGSSATHANGDEEQETAAAFRAILLNGQAATLYDNPLAHHRSSSLEEGEGEEGPADADEYGSGGGRQLQLQGAGADGAPGAEGVPAARQGQGEEDMRTSTRLHHAPASGPLPPLDLPAGMRAQLPAIRNATVLPPPRPSLAGSGPGAASDPLLAAARTQFTSAAEPWGPSNGGSLRHQELSRRQQMAGPVAEARAVSLNGTDPAAATDPAAVDSLRQAAPLMENASVRGQQRAKSAGAGVSALLAISQTAGEWIDRLRTVTSESQRVRNDISVSTSRGEGMDGEEDEADFVEKERDDDDDWQGKAGGDSAHGGKAGPKALAVASQPSGALVNLSQAVWEERLQGRALFIWGPESRFRRGVANLVFNRWFDTAMLFVIVFSCVALVLDAPDLDPESTLASVLRVLDYFFIAAFTLEAALKIITFGFAFTGKHAYIRNGWNVLDFIIVLAGYALIILAAIIGPEGSSKLKVLRVLRSLRALRPLRAVNRFEGLKLVVNTLFAVLPAMGSTLLVCALFYIIFAILFVNLLKGKLFNCVNPESGDRLDPDYLLPPGETLTREWCEVGAQTINSSSYYNGRGITSMPPYIITTSWVNPIANFDNVAVGILTLFQVATMSLWLDITFTAVDSTEIGEQPIWNNQPIYCVLFIIFIVVCSFFVLNLFIGVTLDKFAEIQEETNRAGVMLTQQQQAWVSMQKVLAGVHMQHQPPPPRQKLRAAVHRVVTHSVFEGFIMAVIVVNVLFMAMVHADMSLQWQDVMSYTNLIFTVIFGLEALLKIVAFGPWNYLRDSWNAFDFFVVIISVASVILDFSNTKNLSFMPVLRVLRVVRVLRLVRTAKGMQKLLYTLITSLPALANVGGVMLLFFFIYAIIGVNLFAGIKYGQALNSHANFDRFANAMLLLFRMLTGESWDQVMQDCMVTSDCVLVTAPGGINATDPASTNSTILIPPGTYLNPSDPVLNGLPEDAFDNQCALSPFAAAFYFPTFVVLCTFILLQLVIAVLLENLVQADTDQTLPVAKPDLDAFVAAWSDLDGHATGLAHASQLSVLMMALPPPLGTHGQPDCRMKTARAMLALDIPLYVGNKLSFVEVMHALAGNVCGTELPDAAEEAVRPALARRLPRGSAATRFTAAHYHAADNVRAAIKGFLLRYTYRDQLGDAQFSRQLQGLEEMRSNAAATAGAALSGAAAGGAAAATGSASRRQLPTGGGGSRVQSRQGSWARHPSNATNGSGATGGGANGDGGAARMGSMVVNGRRLSDVRRELADETAVTMHSFTEALLQAAVMGREAEELEERARQQAELSRASTVTSKRSLMGFLGSLGKQQQQQPGGDVAVATPGAVVQAPAVPAVTPAAGVKGGLAGSTEPTGQRPMSTTAAETAEPQP